MTALICFSDGAPFRGKRTNLREPLCSRFRQEQETDLLEPGRPADEAEESDAGPLTEYVAFVNVLLTNLPIPFLPVLFTPAVA
eukprot:2387691-Amphidinium_carterae.1